MAKKEILSDKEIIDLIKKHSDILKKYRVIKMGLFGSYTRGEQKKHSDIDFLVEFDKASFDRNFTGYFDNYIELQSNLRRLFKKRIDLLTTEMISPYIKPYVLKELKYV